MSGVANERWAADSENEAAPGAKIVRLQPEPADNRPPAFSDEALALRFADLHAEDLRYVSAWGKWYRWTGTHWQVEDTMLAFNEARAVCRRAAAECSSTNLARNLASAKTVAAVERLARADRRLAATIEQWDTDPWLLNTPGGVVDLRTGALRPHRPTDYLTRITAVAPGGSCATWDTFLHRATDGDGDLQAFLQRIFGYALTGDTSAQALFFLFGTGANGKSVCIDTIAGILGDYHRTAPIEAFTASSTDRHPTELAGLRGARLVTAVETEEGRRWAESKIKALTGGDKIAARFMRGDFFEYTPQFKLVIAGNHKPGLRSVDEAIRRRFHLVSFNVTIPAEERDSKLKERLQAEWPGILQWMIDGCQHWKEYGLLPPKAVVAATAAYLEAEDAMSAWIDDCCVRDPNEWTSSNELFASWRTWAERAGEPFGSTKSFAQNLETREFEPSRKNHSRGFRGIAINRSDDPRQHWSDQ